MMCKRAQDWISLECDGQLDPEKVPRLLAHLEECTDCRAYREELHLGQRLLAATAAEPAEGFEWRLQLRLNHALKHAAGDAVAPWPSVARPWTRWLGSFTISASVGLAAVLAVALFTMPLTGRGPVVASNSGIGDLERVPVSNHVYSGLFDSSRRPLTTTSTTSRGLGMHGSPYQHTVSLDGGSVGPQLAPSNLLRMQRLQQENEILRRRVLFAESRSQRLQARLDSLSLRPLDNQ